jgi:hypothetical protein
LRDEGSALWRRFNLISGQVYDLSVPKFACYVANVLMIALKKEWWGNVDHESELRASLDSAVELPRK